MKLIAPSHAQWENLGHFLGVAAKAMRSVLVDHARGKQRQKRTRTHLDCVADYYEARSIDTLALHEGQWVAVVKRRDERLFGAFHQAHRRVVPTVETLQHFFFPRRLRPGFAFGVLAYSRPA